MKKRISSFVIICIFILTIPLTVFSHSGRTDSSGGHRDNKNKSGLGNYHYHCGGYPAHLHTYGGCPYKVNSAGESGRSTKSAYVKQWQKFKLKNIRMENPYHIQNLKRGCL